MITTADPPAKTHKYPDDPLRTLHPRPKTADLFNEAAFIPQGRGSPVSGVSTHGRERMALILLVDDSHLGRTLAHLTLTRAGHRVIVARDGREGFDLAQAHNPDLIVAACTLPVLDGVTMVRSLRERGITPPVILVGSGPGWVSGPRTEAREGPEFISISRSIEPHELARAVQIALRPVVAQAA